MLGKTLVDKLLGLLMFKAGLQEVEAIVPEGAVVVALIDAVSPSHILTLLLAIIGGLGLI